jgi:hypothetical protein
MVAGMGGAIPDGAIWPATLLILFGGLYVARGYAVVRTLVGRAGAGEGLPLPLLLAAIFFVLFLVPPTLAAVLGVDPTDGVLMLLLAFAPLMVLGLADTWIDFRHRPAAAPGE